MSIQKKYMLPMAFVLMGSFSIHNWKSDLSPELQRSIASEVSEEIRNQESALPRYELERLGILAVKIDRAKQELVELESEKTYIQEVLLKDNLNEENIDGLVEALATTEKDLKENSEELKSLQASHTEEMNHLIDAYDKQKAILDELLQGEPSEELDQKVVELESLKEAMETLKGDLNGSQESNKNLQEELEQAFAQAEIFQEQEKDIKAAYCQQQDKVSDLKGEVKELLKDKEAVTQKIVAIAEDKDNLNTKIDELRDEVTAEEEKEQVADADFDVTALMSVLTNLTKQLQFNSQMLAMQRSQMPSISSYFQKLSPGAQSMNQYYGFDTSAFQGPFSGPQMNHPFGNYSDFHKDYSFPMMRDYGSDLIGQAQSMPRFNFPNLQQYSQWRNPSGESQEAGSVFFDFNNVQ